MIIGQIGLKSTNVNFLSFLFTGGCTLYGTNSGGILYWYYSFVAKVST